MNPKALALLLVVCATLLAHAAAKNGDYIFFDDGRFVRDNPSLDEVGNPLRFFTDPETVASPDKPTSDIYRPIRTLSFALITQWWGRSDASAFHAVSIVLHAVCAALLACVLMAAGFAVWPAAAGALFWSLHPTTVEVSAWVCSLGDIWCGLFSLLAVWAYAGRRVVLACVALVLALFSKEHAVVVPAIWLAWDFFLRREETRAGLKRAVVPGLVLVIGFLVWRGSLGLVMGQRDEPLGGSFVESTKTMLSGLGWYLGTILLPSGPTFQARVESSTLGVLIGVAILAGLIRAIWRGPGRVRLGAAWFLLALVPVSNIFVPLKIPTADRFLYIPLMGFGLLVAQLCRRWPRPTAWAVPVVLLVLTGLTQQRIGDWRNSDALHKAGMSVDPKSPMLVWYEASRAAQTAIRLLDAEKFSEASPYAERAVALYEVYLRNARSRDTARAGFELGLLLHKMAIWSERLDNEDQYIKHYGSALEAFATAHRMHLQGRGRLPDRYLRLAAERSVQLCMRLAEPGNPYLTRAILLGERMLKFLDARYNAPVGMSFAKLRFVYSTQIRGEDPAKARKGYNQVLTVLDAEKKRGSYTKYLRAQVLLYRAILIDQPAHRGDMERAAQLFLEIESERLDMAIIARFQRAKVYCAMGKVLMSESFEFRASMAKQGREILDSIEEFAKTIRRRIPNRIKKQINSEHRGCMPRR